VKDWWLKDPLACRNRLAEMEWVHEQTLESRRIERGTQGQEGGLGSVDTEYENQYFPCTG